MNAISCYRPAMGFGYALRGLRALVLLACMLAIGACTPIGRYYAGEDAPAFVAAGATDPRLGLTRLFGAPLSPVVRNLRAPHGRLYFRDGLEEQLRAELRPLDIVLIRSRPAATRLLIPSHFTHAMVWLGSLEDLRRAGALALPGAAPYRAELDRGWTVLEASRSDVHLSPISEMIDTNEIVVISMPQRGRAWMRGKYAALFARLGRPFDYSFDYRDERRLTCAELVAEVFPELDIPVRYSNGRYAIIPDDLVRLGLSGTGGLSVRRYIRPIASGGYETASRADLRSVLTAPSQRRVRRTQ